MLSQNNNSPVISNTGDAVLLKKLILSAKKGDKQAFAKVYTALYSPLYRYTISRCKDEELANDLCQQAFLKFYEALASYEPEKSPLAYLFTISKRLLINHWEKKKSEPFDETLLENYSEVDDILDEKHLALLVENINSYIPHLSDDEQEVIRLHFYGELSYKEISEILDKEEAYLRKIKERAIKKLRILTKHLYENR